MPSSTCLDQVANERSVSKLTETLARLTIPTKDLPKPHSVEKTSRSASKDIPALWRSQAKLFQPLFPNAAKILCEVPIPNFLTDHNRIQDYIRSTSITPAGKAYTPQCSEILPERMWIADRYNGTDLSTLRRLAITHVVSVGHDRYHQGCPLLPGFAHKPVIVPLDLYNTSLVGVIDDIVTLIDRALRADPSHRVLVHCAMGIEWSPSIAVAMLMNDTGCDFHEALDNVRTNREVAYMHEMVAKAVQQWWTLEQLRPELPKGRGHREFRWAVEDSDDTE